MNSHPQFRKMGLNAKDARDSSDGESETSLLKRLQELSDCEG